jgi:hypothetical protein
VTVKWCTVITELISTNYVQDVTCHPDKFAGKADQTPGICAPLVVNWIKFLPKTFYMSKSVMNAAVYWGMCLQITVTQLSLLNGLCQCAELHNLQEASVSISRRANPDLIFLLPCELQVGSGPAVPFTFQTNSWSSYIPEFHITAVLSTRKSMLSVLLTIQ